MTLVLGLGNILCGDDGVGVRVAELLKHCDLPAGVQVEIAGTPGLGLPAWLEGYRRAILVDAVRMGLQPGDWRRFTLAEARLLSESDPLSLHQSGLSDGLELAGVLGLLPESLAIYGVEPSTLELDAQLSPVVEAALPALVQSVLGELWHESEANPDY